MEMVDSLGDGIQMPNFEVLNARIASALNRRIHNSHFKRRVSLEEQKAQKKDRFLRGRQIAYLIYEYFRVTGANDSVENYADLFNIGLRNDDIQEFDSKWDGFFVVSDEDSTRLRHRQQHQVIMRLEKERIKVKVILLPCLCQPMLTIDRGNPLSTKPIKIQKQIKKGNQDRTGQPAVFRHPGVAARIQRKFGG